MSGSKSVLAPPGLPGGSGPAASVSAEDAQAEAALVQRCLVAGVPYLAPGAGRYSQELNQHASSKQRGAVRRQRHDKLRKDIGRAGRGSMVRSSVDTLGFNGWSFALASSLAMASG